MNDKLQKVIDVLPIMHELSDDGSYLTVMESNGIVQGFAIPKGEKPLLPIGGELKDPSGAFDEVVKTGKKKYNYLPKEVMGVAFEGVLVPIKDGSQVVGVLIYTHSVNEKEVIRDMTTEFKKSITDIDEATSNIINGFDNINTILKGMKERTTKVDGSVKAATKVVNLIQSNAKHSTILALNASIEAARSGEAGRGFTVVASEMGKLSNASGSSAKEINTALVDITKQMEDITQAILATNDVADTYLDDIHKTKEVLGKTLLLADELQKKI